MTPATNFYQKKITWEYKNILAEINGAGKINVIPYAVYQNLF
jgi:hypothetical protein